MNFFQDIFNFVLPSYCSICRKALEKGEKVVCDECFNNIPIIVPPFCERCGKPTENEAVCNECIEYPHEVARTRALGEYKEPLSSLILLIKSMRPKISITKRLGILMSRILKEDEILSQADALVPVPLYPVRKRERGFNQSEILSHEISNYIGIPELTQVLLQIKPTKPQKSFTSEELEPQEKRKKRVKNVKDAFKVKKTNEIKGKKIILIDDVMTTGATLDECARELYYEAEASEVYAIVAARA
ncbi:ComF family protein [candidate division WOR-3 bacterium]|nr:ComF family protein [candidate division WOR-3 bacterium]